MANDLLGEVIIEASKEQNQKAVIGVLEMVRVMMDQDKHFIVPVEWGGEAKQSVEIQNIDGKETAVFVADSKMELRHINGKNNEDWLVAFSCMDELHKGAPSFCVPAKVKDMLEIAMNSDAKGIVLNPFGTPFLLGKTLIQMVFDASKIAKDEAQNGDYTFL